MLSLRSYPVELSPPQIQHTYHVEPLEPIFEYNDEPIPFGKTQKEYAKILSDCELDNEIAAVDQHEVSNTSKTFLNILRQERCRHTCLSKACHTLTNRHPSTS